MERDDHGTNSRTLLAGAIALLASACADPITGSASASEGSSQGAEATTSSATGSTEPTTTATVTSGSSTTTAATASTTAASDTDGTTTTTSASDTDGTTTGPPDSTSTTSDGTGTGTTEGVSTSGSTTGGCDPGTEGCACLPGDLCVGRLACIDQLCGDPPAELCGDGIVDPGEACDDGNDVDADGCTSQCQPTQVLEVKTSINVTCVRLTGGYVKCWGAGDTSQVGQPGYGEKIGDDEVPAEFPPIQLGGEAVQLALGSNHVCAVMANKDLRCWGYSNFGQHGLGHKLRIGDDEHPSAAPPVMIGGSTLLVASQREHSCAIVDGGAVRCFGNNIEGALGYGHLNPIGDNEHPASQQPVKLGEPAIGLATGLAHSCAVLASKTLRCWGSNLSGPLGLGFIAIVGDNDHPDDFPKPAFADIEMISAGTTHTCILQTGGVVRCFGDNWAGKLGYGNTKDIGDNDSPDGGPVALGGKATKIACGGDVSCALLESGAVRCWGSNKWGQLGLGHINDVGDDELPSSVPPIDLGGKAVDVSTSGQHTCAVLAGGGLRCWGYPTNGALGLGEVVIIGDDEHPADIGLVEVF